LIVASLLRWERPGKKQKHWGGHSEILNDTTARCLEESEAQRKENKALLGSVWEFSASR
jgi:hypothetical protein